MTGILQISAGTTLDGWIWNWYGPGWLEYAQYFGLLVNDLQTTPKYSQNVDQGLESRMDPSLSENPQALLQIYESPQWELRPPSEIRPKLIKIIQEENPCSISCKRAL
jgi:hypothetical protein